MFFCRRSLRSRWAGVLYFFSFAGKNKRCGEVVNFHFRIQKSMNSISGTMDFADNSLNVLVEILSESQDNIVHPKRNFRDFVLCGSTFGLLNLVLVGFGWFSTAFGGCWTGATGHPLRNAVKTFRFPTFLHYFLKFALSAMMWLVCLPGTISSRSDQMKERGGSACCPMICRMSSIHFQR